MTTIANHAPPLLFVAWRRKVGLGRLNTPSTTVVCALNKKANLNDIAL